MAYVEVDQRAVATAAARSRHGNRGALIDAKMKAPTSCRTKENDEGDAHRAGQCVRPWACPHWAAIARFVIRAIRHRPALEVPVLLIMLEYAGKVVLIDTHA